MSRRSVAIAGTFFLAALTLAACGGGQPTAPAPQPSQAAQPATQAAQPAAAKKIKVAWVEFASETQSSWVRANVEAAKQAEKDMPEIEGTIVQSVPDGPGVVPVLTKLAQDGNQVIFADSYGYAQFVPGVAEKFPKVDFIQQEFAPVKAPNIGFYYGYQEEARYLQGIIAGLVTKGNVIGFVGAQPVPVVISGINAFALGVRSVNPKAVVKVNWVNNWYDPPKEKEAADALLDQGADIIANQVDSPTTLQAAAARGKYGMTNASDWSQAAPQAFLTGNVWHWNKYYEQTIKDVENGTWKAGTFMGTLANGVVDLAPFGPGVTQQAKDAVAKARQELISGSLKIFKGPIKDNAGTIRIPDGQTMSYDDAEAKMDWLVEGIQGSTK